MAVVDFIQFCDMKNLPLPATQSENTKRAGLSQEYPDGYVRSQYPDAYFSPIVATAYLDLKNAKSNNRKAAGPSSPL